MISNIINPNKTFPTRNSKNGKTVPLQIAKVQERIFKCSQITHLKLEGSNNNENKNMYKSIKTAIYIYVVENHSTFLPAYSGVFSCNNMFTHRGF